MYIVTGKVEKSKRPCESLHSEPINSTMIVNDETISLPGAELTCRCLAFVTHALQILRQLVYK